MSAAPQASAPTRGLTLAQRIALGLLARGALQRRAVINGAAPVQGAVWTSRAFPGEAVRDGTMRALERQGLARLSEMTEGGDTALIALATVEGTEAYRAARGRYCDVPLLPPSVAQELAEIDCAAGSIEGEAVALVSAVERTLAAARRASEELAAIEREGRAIIARLRKLEAWRATIDSRRAALEQLVVGMAEARR